jgi:hypothetical protein
MGLVATGAAEASADSAQADEPWYLWTENEQAWCLWLEVQTQWQHAGWAGLRTGLCYAGVQVVLAHLVRPAQRTRRFQEIKAMERAALDAWAGLRAAGKK